MPCKTPGRTPPSAERHADAQAFPADGLMPCADRRFQYAGTDAVSSPRGRPTLSPTMSAHALRTAKRHTPWRSMTPSFLQGSVSRPRPECRDRPRRSGATTALHAGNLIGRRPWNDKTRPGMRPDASIVFHTGMQAQRFCGRKRRTKAPASARARQNASEQYQAFTTMMRGETLPSGTGSLSSASMPKRTLAGREAIRRCISMSTANS